MHAIHVTSTHTRCHCSAARRLGAVTFSASQDIRDDRQRPFPQVRVRKTYLSRNMDSKGP